MIGVTNYDFKLTGKANLPIVEVNFFKRGQAGPSSMGDKAEKVDRMELVTGLRLITTNIMGPVNWVI